jgi:hypothetical protein
VSAQLAALVTELRRRAGVRVTVGGVQHEVRLDMVRGGLNDGEGALTLDNLELLMRADPAETPPPRDPRTGQAVAAEPLTPEEKEVVFALGRLWGDFCALTSDGPTRDEDLREAMHHFHALQRMVGAQAAARAYPEAFRPLGGDAPEPKEPFPFEAFGVPRRPEQ